MVAVELVVAVAMTQHDVADGDGAGEVAARRGEEVAGCLVTVAGRRGLHEPLQEAMRVDPRRLD